MVVGVVTLVPPRLVVAVLINGHSILRIPVLVRDRASRGVPNRCTVPRYGSGRQVARVDAIQIVVVLFPEGAHVPLCTLSRRLPKVPKPVSHLYYIQADLQRERSTLLDGRVRCQSVEFFEGVELVWLRTRS